MDEIYIKSFIILLIASFTQGFSGFGFALVSIPLLSLVVDVKHAVPLGALCGLVINVFLAVELRLHIKLFDLKRLIWGAAAGIPGGVLFLSAADSSLIKMILAIIVLAFVILSATNLIKPKGIHYNWGYPVGFISGILGGALNTNGPPVLIYFYLQGWDKLKQKASITGYFLFSSVLIVIAHIATGLTTKNILTDFISFLPAVILGILLGQKLFKKISTEIYNKFVLGGLFLVSIFLIFG